MVSIVAVNITGLLIERESEQALQAQSDPYRPVPIVAGAFSPEQVEDTVQQALHLYFSDHGILADLTVAVEPAEQIEQGLFPEDGLAPIDYDNLDYPDYDPSPA